MVHAYVFSQAADEPNTGAAILRSFILHPQGRDATRADMPVGFVQAPMRAGSTASGLVLSGLAAFRS